MVVVVVVVVVVLLLYQAVPCESRLCPPLMRPDCLHAALPGSRGMLMTRGEGSRVAISKQPAQFASLFKGARGHG